jgi:hypothetical protein
MHEILKDIMKKPQSYAGDDPQPFITFMAFVSGYIMASETARKSGAPPLPDFLPRDFGKFVCCHFGVKDPEDPATWISLIRKHTSSQPEAYALMIRLLEDYEKGLK